MAGDLTEIEVCDVCGKEVSEFSIIEGLVVCEDCKENFELEKTEDNSSHVCAICGWPIQRVIDKNEAKTFVKGIEKWLREKGVKKDKFIEEFFEKLKRREHYLCRYDFFYMIKDRIESFSKELAEEFEKEIASQYEFFGSLIS